MRSIAKIQSRDKEALFHNTAAAYGMNEAIIEKDFWVCWILDYLFNQCKWKDNLAFKGGTSLSKAYNLIERFSEDIDLVLDWCLLGFEVDEPWDKRSNNKQHEFNKKANLLAEDFLRYEFIPQAEQDLSDELNTPIKFIIDADDRQTVKFRYPQAFSDGSILQEIRLEIGALATWTPVADKNIIPYSAEKYPKLFSQPNTSVRTVLPERTFWEKITILHSEAHRPENKSFPSRYSRHYYDLCCMSKSKVEKEKFSNPEMLDEVVAFKKKFYPLSWAGYDSAKIGCLELIPPKYNMKALEDDYEHMKNMIFGSIPEFEDIIGDIQKLEELLNAL